MQTPRTTSSANGDLEGSQIDAEEFAARFCGSYRKLWLIAVGITSDRTQADDVVQQAATIALEKLDCYQPGTSFPAWMAQIVRFVALNALRLGHRRATTATDPVALDGLGSDSPGNATVASSCLCDGGRLSSNQQAFDDQVVHALNQLSDVARSCLLLRTIEQLSYAEIADVLQIAEGTAMSHVHRSKRDMRNYLERWVSETVGRERSK